MFSGETRDSQRNGGRWRGDEPDVRVLIVDDQAVFRDALRTLVEAAPGFMLVAEATCGEDALAAIEEVSPQLVVIDVRMPGLGGVETARAMRERVPQLALLLVSAQPAPGPWQTACEELELPFAAKAELCPGVLRQTWEQRNAIG